MAKDDRLYTVTYPNSPERPAYMGDIGQILQITGLVMGGMGTQVLFWLPEHHNEPINRGNSHQVRPTVEEWAEIIRNSDHAEYLDESQKKWLRKAQYVISGMVQQRVWRAWDYKCVFCGRMMGEVQLTVDHFVPIEMGGVNNEINYVSACRKCNKDKGNIDPREWCRERGHNYTYIQRKIAELAPRIRGGW